MTGGKRKRLLRSRVGIYGAVALIGVVAAFWYASIFTRPPAQPPEALETVRIGAVQYLASCPVVMAQANHYFENEGIAAVINFEANGSVALRGALDGRSDLVTVADLPVALAAASGRQVAVVATMATTEDHAVVARRDRGIDSPDKLKGKRVGVSLGTTTEFYLAAFLNRWQLSPTDVVTADLTPTQLREGIARGDLDAVVLYQPFLNASLEALGPKVVAFSPEGLYYLSWNLAGLREYVNAHPRTVEKILRATIRGVKACTESPDAARAVLARMLDLPAGILRDLWPLYRFDVSLRQSLLLTLEDEGRWAVRNKVTADAKLPNYLDNLSLEPLQSVAPSAVTVFH